MDLSILIVNHHTKSLLKDCLTSLIETMPAVEYEIIVVNNTPEDGCSEMLAEIFPAVRVWNNAETRGFAWNNNRALQLSSGRLIWMLNPDTIIKPGACQKMLDFLESHPQAGLVGPRSLNAEGGVDIYACSRFPGLWVDFISIFALSRFCLRFPAIKGPLYPQVLQDQPFQSDKIIGASILFRREVIEQAGFLDEQFFMYFEETDWCFRVRKAGWEIWQVPEAVIVHIYGGSAGGENARLMLHYVKSQQQYYRKNLGAFQAVLVRLIMIAGLSLRLVKWNLVKIIAPGRKTRANEEISKWTPPLRWLLTQKA